MPAIVCGDEFKVTIPAFVPRVQQIQDLFNGRRCCRAGSFAVMVDDDALIQQRRGDIENQFDQHGLPILVDRRVNAVPVRRCSRSPGQFVIVNEGLPTLQYFANSDHLEVMATKKELIRLDRQSCVSLRHTHSKIADHK